MLKLGVQSIRLATVLLSWCSITSCEIGHSYETGHFYLDRQYIEADLCAGMYSIEAMLKNGPKVNRDQSNLFFEEKLENIDSFYVRQNAETVCWAASLETVFRFLGYKYRQQQFLDSLDKHCPSTISDEATLNQIIFAATDVHLVDGGQWLGQYPTKGIDIDFGDFINLLNLIPGIQAEFKMNTSHHREAEEFFLIRSGGQAQSGSSNGVYWKPTSKGHFAPAEGGLTIIRSLDDLIIAMDHKYPVVVGLEKGGSGHTVVLTQIVFFPGGGASKNSNGAYTYNVNKKAYLYSVEYLDPNLGPTPIRMGGSEFLEDVIFSFYVDP